ncbi:hypothetical protein R5R35_005414 [Gryllus longicercus]|uniref:Uncharacterized protein n=1 Tax=Gryllus longicercus TaxID=2509291 RepID=A0AAN9VHA7_9ORTH
MSRPDHVKGRLVHYLGAWLCPPPPLLGNHTSYQLEVAALLRQPAVFVGGLLRAVAAGSRATSEAKCAE